MMRIAPILIRTTQNYQLLCFLMVLLGMQNSILIDLDLFFLDKTFRVIDIQKAVPITLNPKTWKIHKNKNARYCLEIKAGLVSAIKGMEIIWKW